MTELKTASPDLLAQGLAIGLHPEVFAPAPILYQTGSSGRPRYQHLWIEVTPTKFKLLTQLSLPVIPPEDFVAMDLLKDLEFSGWPSRKSLLVEPKATSEFNVLAQVSGPWIGPQVFAFRPIPGLLMPEALGCPAQNPLVELKGSEPDLLAKVTVRLIRSEERARFDQLLESEHYLHSARLGGQSLRYVGEVEGQWVGLLTFSGAAPHTKAREEQIRWTPRQRARRLSFVVNNSRFLLLAPRQKYPNLPSRLLGLCLKRLNADWQRDWGHPVLLVESYVDESQYRGTCYKACGFQAVGLTAGYGRSSRDYYVEHGQPKQLYLRELRPRAMAILRQGRLPADLAQHEEKISGPCPLRARELDSLLELFRLCKDPRRGHGLRHPQPFVLACAAVAMLMGAGGYEAFAEECRKLSQRQLRALGCRQNPKTGRYRPPSGSTFFRVLNGVDAADFDLLIGQWMMAQEISILQSLAVDGKCLRGSGRTDGKALQLLSAVSHQLRLTVAQEPIEQKSNEIPALKRLLNKLPKAVLEGTMITADALHCQQESSRFVTQELGGDYLWGLKGNQSGILQRAQSRLPQKFFSL